LLIDNGASKEDLAKAFSDSNVRRIVAATLDEPKSANQLSTLLNLPNRSLYRYVDELCKLGVLAKERMVVRESGGKFVLYRSMVKSITLKYETDGLEVDLIPNEKILERFLRFWSYMRG
jgi:predicted transcriptional regulator